VKWEQIKDEWPEALCWGMVVAILWAVFVIGTANWIICSFALSPHLPPALPWELINSLIFGLLGMKGLNIVDKKTNARGADNSSNDASSGAPK
jgi:hypothetical protein